ncbi:hypothetical protein GCM10010885_16870 [Alicyclobacillus cellulosilyticus]|uniref:Uncharacterized protein n=1 Tax=Alicyclobacillus cellulosilyticus TaxID=1003997 RepID=A0A917KBY9_9BACL|nr:hypothetical protein [Alicyclobacillus cellulosilyticus]GGJ08374.1 hypothetical protein GCM10010885_16870 [Alicyclobacillus cellulosilyticus]
MLWSEVRELFPNQYVLVKELKSHYVGEHTLHIEEVALVRTISDPHQAWIELFSAPAGHFVYHTSHPEIVIELKTKPMVRRRSIHEN